MEEAELLHKAALKINTELNLQEGVAREHGNLGLVHMRRKELDEAQRFFGMALDAYTNLGHVLGIAEQKRNLGELANQRGDRGAACRIWADALRLSRDIGARSHSEQTLPLMRDAGCRNIPVRPSDALHD